MLRVLFLGTPEFAAIPLRALAHDPRYSVVGVVTQPDRPAGRSSKMLPPPVKQEADRLGIPVMQPETLRGPDAAAQLAALQPDVGVVAAYGELLRKNILAIPPLGYVNIHPSLLPRYRGSAPINGAILSGDSETGVTVMLLESKMDAGPILAQQRVPLPPDARAGTLTTELFELGSALLLETLARYADRQIEPVAQDDQQATYTQLLRKTDGTIDWGAPAAQIERMTRAYDPWPGAWTSWRGQPIRVGAAIVDPSWQGAAQPGAVLDRGPGIWVATGAGALELREVQPSGKRMLPAADWWRGVRDRADARFGS